MSVPPRKKTAAQLDREITDALAVGPLVTISVHENDDDEADEETYTISDNGGEYDDVADSGASDVQGHIDERRAHYRALGRRIKLDVPAGRAWY
jgi:hypothetical protein